MTIKDAHRLQVKQNLHHAVNALSKLIPVTKTNLNHVIDVKTTHQPNAGNLPQVYEKYCHYAKVHVSE